MDLIGSVGLAALGVVASQVEIARTDRGICPEHQGDIVATVSLLTLGAAIVVRLAQRRGRRLAQTQLVRCRRVEQLIEDASATLTSLPLSRLDEHIRTCLRRLAVLLGVDQVALWRLSRDQRTLTRTHFWAAEGISPPPAAVPVTNFGPPTPALERSCPGDPLAALRPTAAGTRPPLERISRDSLAVFPLQICGRVLGSLTVVRVRAGRRWTEEDLHQLQTLAELFATAIEGEEIRTALESSEAFADTVLAALPGEIATLDVDGIIVQVNEAWARFARTAGVSIALGDDYLAACRSGRVLPAEHTGQVVELVEAVLAGRRETGELEYPIPEPGGTDRWYQMRVERVRRPGAGAAIMRSDITARKTAEAVARLHLSEVAHMDRVEAMGRLASSIAHELKQPLTAILTNAQTAQRLLAATPPDLAELQACLVDIIDDDRRAGEILRRMRRLLKKQDLEVTPIDLNGVVVDAAALVANDALLHEVVIELTPARALPVVHADAVSIEQVVLNLLTNALAAAATGPAVPRRVRVWTNSTDGERVEIGVHDSGKGLAEADLAHIFEPFYTTRSDGLGVGLTISRSIIEAHGGRITAENDPTGGAVFRVDLPTRAERAA